MSGNVQYFAAEGCIRRICSPILATAEDRGERRGRQERNLEFARMMLSDGEPIEKIMRYTGLTRQEITQL